MEHIHAHQGIIRKISRMYTNNPEDAQDLFQEIVLQLWKSYGSFKGNSQFSTWLYRVAVNTSMTYLQLAKKIITSINHEHVIDNHGSSADDQLQQFYRAIQILNPVEKAFVFLFLEGLSHKEIAAHLGITEVHARVKLNRIKQKLQEIIKTIDHEY